PRWSRHLCRQGARQGSDHTSGLCRRGTNLRGVVRHEIGSCGPRPHDVRGRWRVLQHVLPTAAVPRGSAAPQPCPPQDRGLLFRSEGTPPDPFAGNLPGLSLKPEVFHSDPGGSRNNLLAIYQHVRRNDLFATYAIVPPQGARNKDYYLAKGL